MYIKIYADVIFAINFFMDFFIFWIVYKLIKEKVNFFKLLFGSFFCAFTYCLFIFIPILKNFYNFFTSIFILSTGIFITFKVKNVKEFLKLIFYTHLSSFMIGGVAIGLFYYTNIKNIIGNITNISVPFYSFKFLLISISLVYIILKLSISYIRNILIFKKSFYNVSIFFNENTANIRALVDTGNSLKDPLSNYPVMVAEFKSIKNILPHKIQLLFCENKNNDTTAILKNISESNMKNKIRVIPFKSLGKENGMILGFKPDKIEIKKEDNILELKNIIVGIYNNNFSKNGDFQGLLNAEMIKN